MKPIVLCACLALAVSGQTPPLSFKSASVSPTQPGGESRPTSISSGITGKLAIRNAPLKTCLVWAYDLPGYLISGDGHLFPDRYDIDARAPLGSGADGYRRMLQTLLASYFKVQVHLETRSIPSYVLSAAGNGHKLQPAKGNRGGFHAGHGRLSGDKVTASELAARLSVLLNRPVVDATGIAGPFAFSLTWGQLELKRRETAGTNPIFAAIEQQLGLKLEPQDRPAEVLVVDHAEKPAEAAGKATPAKYFSRPLDVKRQESSNVV